MNGDYVQCGSAALSSRPVQPDRPKRYDQCDETCTVDCGHCKGAGRPVQSEGEQP